MPKPNDNEKMAKKLIALFSDPNVNSFDWKHNIPMHFIQIQPHLRRNAKNFAEGLNFIYELYEVEVPKENNSEIPLILPRKKSKNKN